RVDKALPVNRTAGGWIHFVAPEDEHFSSRQWFTGSGYVQLRLGCVIGDGIGRVPTVTGVRHIVDPECLSRAIVEEAGSSWFTSSQIAGPIIRRRSRQRFCCSIVSVPSKDGRDSDVDRR